MAVTEQIELASFIKNVHEELRIKSQLIGMELTWKEHCQNSDKLEAYAAAMRKLATNYWDSACEANQHISRIMWIHQACKDYFSSISSIRIKEQLILEKINWCSSNVFSYASESTWKLLDVGSCYNPFKGFSEFEVTAIDIAPAHDTVLKCDFMNVEIGKQLLLSNAQLHEIPMDYYDVVVFSLFLEYLPCPLKRKLCCVRAKNILKREGILVIITPDSNHIGSNAKYIKSWRFVLAQIGFTRVKYEKLKHLHCMVFRKCPVKEIALRWADIHKAEQTFDEIYIPQDFKKKPKVGSKTEKLTSEDVMAFNLELPFSDAID